jgi:hypothetical protein
LTTGKIVKLMAYINRLAKLIKQPINFYDEKDDDGDSCKSDRLNVNTHYDYDEYPSYAEYKDVCITFAHDYPDSIQTILRKLSGDTDATAVLRANFDYYDSEHKNPKYSIMLTIDKECITIDEDGWQ